MIRIFLMVLATIFVGLMWGIFMLGWAVFSFRLTDLRRECSILFDDFKEFWKDT